MQVKIVVSKFISNKIAVGTGRKGLKAVPCVYFCISSRDIMAFVEDFLIEIWQVFLALSPSLLLGLAIAGILHVVVPEKRISSAISGADTSSVLKSVLFGVPMPLCSCGVVPTAMGLRKQGASRGATTAFLISTPQTGVDSILVTASFLGWPLALFKVAASFVTGLVGGMWVNTLKGEAFQESQVKGDQVLSSFQEVGPNDVEGKESLRAKAREMVRYGIFDILASIDKWIVIGVVASALISLLVPAGSLNEYSWSQGIWGMLAVLLLAIPLYVCTTGSVPMVAALIASGMPAGSALVFLMAGPATNIATIGAMFRTLGRKAMAVYLAVVVSFSLLFGWLFERWLPTPETLAKGSMAETSWWAQASSVLVALLLAYLLMGKLLNYFSLSKGNGGAMDMVIQVKDMSCAHCVQSVKKALEAVEGVGEATPDLDSGQVMIKKVSGSSLPDRTVLEQAIEQSGYSVVR